jgi:peptidyl-prolyl cis-trans isomerase-like 4
VVLEMIGDLPEADAAPPSNMLFVCKLNAVTTEEDLETLFARCGASLLWPCTSSSSH